MSTKRRTWDTIVRMLVTAFVAYLAIGLWGTVPALAEEQVVSEDSISDVPSSDDEQAVASDNDAAGVEDSALDEGETDAPAETAEQVVVQDDQASADATDDESDAVAEEQDPVDEEDAEDAVVLTAAAANIASGKWGTCSWEISSNGVLRVHAGTGEDVGGLPGEETTTEAPWSGYSSSIKQIQIVPENGKKVVAPYYSDYLFQGCKNLVSADCTGLDMSDVWSMRYLFDGCSVLTSVNMTGWDISNVYNACMVFHNCSSLTSLDVSKWNTFSLSNAASMFSGCSSLRTLDVSGWDTRNLTYAGYMFEGCTSLSKIDVSRWETPWIFDMYAMFSDCSSVTSLDFSNWDMSEVYYTQYAFDGCKSLAHISVGSKFEFGAFPNPKGSSTGLWKSKKTGKTYLASEVRSSRSGIADTYDYAGNKSPVSISTATVDSIGNKYYTGSAVKPSVTVKMGSTKLVAGTDYALSYKNNTKPGTATVTITGKGAYTGTKSVTFKIVVKKPTWSGASKLPVAATADISVTNGGYIRLKVGGKWTTSDKVLSLSAPSTTTKRITGKAAGTTTLYLLNAAGQQVASKKVTVYSISGKQYELQSAVDSRYVLDIRGKSKANSARMIVWPRNNGKNQRYQFVKQSDGTYGIKCVHSGKYVDVQGGGTKKSQPVIQYTWNGGKNQRWKITVDAKNRVTFVSAKSGMVFDIQGGKVTKRAQMIQYPFNGGNNQKWVLNQK